MNATQDRASAYWWATNLQTYLDRFLAAPSAATHGPLIAILGQYRNAVEKREVAPPTKTWDGATRQDN
jgi:hypothetical protein